MTDFRSQEVDALDELLTDNVSSLTAAAAFKLKMVAQDGMRARASAGAASFRQEARIEAALARQAELAAIRKQQGKDPAEARSSTFRGTGRWTPWPVQSHLVTWLALNDDGTGCGISGVTEREFRRYLECGILVHGFDRARCADCGHDFLVEYSCRGRGVRPVAPGA